MKYLKKYNLYLEQDDTSDDISSLNTNDINKSSQKINTDSLDMIKKDIEVFNSKKSVIESIFKNMDMNDSDIDKEIQQKVFNNQNDVSKRNKYLSYLISIYKLKRRVDKIGISIEEDIDRRSDAQKNTRDLIDRFNQLQNDEQKSKVDSQRKKSEDYVRELDLKIDSNKKELALSEKNYQKKKVDFESMMKVEEDKIKKLQN